MYTKIVALCLTEKSMQTFSAKKFCKETSPYVTDTDQSKKCKIKDAYYCTTPKYKPKKCPQRNKFSTSDTTCSISGRNKTYNKVSFECPFDNYGNHTLSIFNSA